MRIKRKEEIEEDVERLEDWLLKQPHLPHGVQKGILLSFVLGTKSLEIAKRKLEAYFTWRGHMSNVFSSSVRDSSDPYFKQCSKAGQIFFLPKTTPEGYRVMFCSFTNLFEETYDHDQTTAAFFMSLELAMDLWPDMKGLCLVADVKIFSASHVTKINLSTLQASSRCFLESFPLRLKRAVVFNAVSFIDIVYNNVLKPVLDEKFSKRITITRNDLSSVETQIPSEILPSDYGGNEKSSSELYDEWLKLLEEKKDWFKMTSALIADESKRLSQRKHSFGLEGTFRKLDID